MDSYQSLFGFQYGRPFPDPFNDYASRVIPTNIRQALRFCQGLFYYNPLVRETARRTMAVFITEIELKGSDNNSLGQDERDKYKEFLEKDMAIYQRLQEVTLDLMCFQGDTKVPTREGLFAIRDLVGRTVDVISQGGVYRPAEFKSFGRQKLMEVEFSDGQKFLATPEHQWVVKNMSGKMVKLPTSELRPNHRIPRTVAPRPEKNEDYFEGVRHGFVFGDGSIYNKDRKTPKAVAFFFGEKDDALIPFFEGHGCSPTEAKVLPGYKVASRRIHGLPKHYKLTMPSDNASPSYWYGFVSGFLAADGHVCCRDGCAMLAQKDRGVLEKIAEHLPRIGMSCGPVSQQTRDATFKRPDGSEYTCPESTNYHLTLLRQSMEAGDFLIRQHRENFESNRKVTNFGKFIGVKSVKETGVVEEVFCCVEPETHTFVVGNSILTGNCYGNSFSAVYVPVNRSLYCGPCQEQGRYAEYPARDVLRQPHFKFSWEIPKFFAHCPVCKKKTQWGRVDRRSDGSDAIIRRYGPQEIDIRYDENRDYREYIWLIPNSYRKKVDRGDPQVLESVPWEVVECVQTDSNLLFEKDYIYHMYEPTMSGLDHQGWGLPRGLVNARPAFQYQVLNRQNEALSMDYVTPMRWITPDVRGGGQGEENDPLASIDLGEFRVMVEDAVEKHRFDPATVHYSAYPLRYTVMGGEAGQFAPVDMLNYSADMLLNAMGFPSTLFRGELDIKTALPAIRLFQSYWSPLVRFINGFVDWTLTRVGEERGWEPVTGSLVNPTLIDDPQLIMAKLQLAQSGDFSKTDAVRALGADYRTQLEQQADEERLRTKIQEELQREQEQKGQLANVAAQQQQGAQGQGGGGDGGQGGGGGGETNIQQGQGGGPVQGTGPILPNQNITPQQLLGMADAEAGRMLGMSDGERQGELAKLKSRDPTLHMAVSQSIKDKRRQAQQQGGSQVLQQQYGGQ